MLAALLLAVLVTPALGHPKPHHSPIFGDTDSCGYKSCHPTDPNALNIHIVPHTHDDVGWLKTVDQYYYGSSNRIQLAGVQYILDSVVKELWENPKRKFMYVETAFFWQWWTRQTQSMQNKVRTLVKEGRLQFVSGAWSMNDEAASHYQSTIDQFTWGLRKLNDTFGACGLPRVGWQIDPFGHSREFASLLAAMGYDGLFLGRIDYQDKRKRLESQSMEMVWRGDDDLGKSSDIFTGVLYNTYSPPSGYCFDILCQDDPIVDDVNSPLYNVDSRLQGFISFVTQQRARFRTNNVIMTMGGDFTYQDATVGFSNLDLLIKYGNIKSAKEDWNMNFFYSTPDCYLKAVKDANPTLPTKQSDFFPYASDPHAYWTGYFTSRPTTKYFERETNSYSQMAKQLQVTAGLTEDNEAVLDEIKSAMGIMQHHDAITGTEKQHVAHDYERIMDSAIENSLVIPRQAINKIQQGDAEKPFLFSFDRCRLNESDCSTSEESEKFVVTLYNPLGWKVSASPIRIPVQVSCSCCVTFSVVAPNGDKIDSQLVPISSHVLSIPTRAGSKATHELVFIAKHIKPLGVKSFYVTRNQKDDDVETLGPCVPEARQFVKELSTRLAAAFGVQKAVAYLGQKISPMIQQGKKGMKKRSIDCISNDMMLSDQDVIQRYPEDNLLQNKNLKLRINNATGQISHIYLQDGEEVPFTVTMAYYTGHAGKNDAYENRASGAYIFRPELNESIDIQQDTSNIISGVVADELQYQSGNYTSGSVRLYKDANIHYIEHEWVVGPIPVEDKIGKEIIVKYSTAIDRGEEFFTDSNGRQMLKRIFSKRPDYELVEDEEPISSNYYPVTNKIYIKDDKLRLAVLTDRSEGGSSIKNGEIELMLHRRLLYDDAFGVDEALNERYGGDQGEGLIVRGKHRIIFSQPNNEEQKISESLNTHELHLEPKVFISNSEHVDLAKWLTLNNCVGGLKSDLPKGIHLLTLEPWKGSTLLLRLENYLESDYSKSDIIVDINDMFSSINVKSVKETMLAANRWVGEYDKWKFNTENAFVKSFNDDFKGDGGVLAEDRVVVRNDDGFKVKLRAKEIRTFIIGYSFKGFNKKL